ncbi:hypothetical protein V1512DRAFT_194836, partial [Lipomyces arxii]|uniref:uncharacterized protein n=1 Tax=Lipomyces arxii TaxID=56418 RepID=UPI0034CEC951
DVHIVCTESADFDIVLALASALILPPSAHQDEFLDQADVDLEALLVNTSNQRINLTVIDATTGIHDLDTVRYVMTREVRLLPLTMVKSTELVHAPDSLFLASCMDDADALRDDITKLTLLGTRVHCVVRNPSKVGAQQSAIMRLAAKSEWSFIGLTTSDLKHMESHFPALFGPVFKSDAFKGLLSLIFPHLSVTDTPTEPTNLASVLGGDLLPVHDKQRKYQEVINTYATTLPRIKVQLIDCFGSGKTKQYVIPHMVAHDSLFIGHNLPLRTYLDRVAKSRIVVPLPLDAQSARTAERIVSVALSTGRPLLLPAAVYASYFAPFVPAEMVVIADNVVDYERTLIGLKDFALDADEEELKRKLTAAQDIRAKLLRRNFMVMNHIVENV